MDISKLKLEKYEAQGGRVTPIVSLGKNGNIYLSAGLTKKYGIENNTHAGVSLYYDRQNMVIAIELLKEKRDGMLSISVGTTGGAIINSKAFAIKYDLMKESSLKDDFIGQYNPVNENVPGVGHVLLINLNEKRK